MKRWAVSTVIFLFLVACSGSSSERGDMEDIGVVDVGDGGGGNGGQGGGEQEQPGVDYPYSEPLVKILTPSSTGYATSMGQVISVAGIVFGPVSRLYLVTPDGQNHPLEGKKPYWESEGITLSPGDNTIEVVAEGNGKQTSDHIVITYNPGILITSPPRLKPPALFVGQTVQIHATFKAPRSALIQTNTIKLYQCDAQGKPLQAVGVMKDDGASQSSGDEIQSDGVYTIQFNGTCSAPGRVVFRVGFQVNSFGNTPSYTAYSQPFFLECIPLLTRETCNAHKVLLRQAKDAYYASLNNGADLATAKRAAYLVLQQSPDVAQMGDPSSNSGIWVRFKDGILGALNTAIPGTRGTPGAPAGGVGEVTSSVQNFNSVLSKNVLIWSPMSQELEAQGNLDEGRVLSDMLKAKQCPTFDLDGPWTNGAAKLKFIRNIKEYGVIALIGHAGVYFDTLPREVQTAYNWPHIGAQEVFWSGEAVECSRLLERMTTCSSSSDCPPGSECLQTSVTLKQVGNDMVAVVQGICYNPTQVDLMTGRVVMGADTYGFTPAMVQHYGEGGGAQSLVYLGGCNTMYNGSLAAAFLSSGAASVVGYPGTVSNEYAYNAGAMLFDALLNKGDRIGIAVATTGIDPHFSTRMMLFGSRWLNLSDYRLLNGSFENPGLLGWKKSGDARVISHLGHAGPVKGKRMAIISTGLGFTTKTGSIVQKFCLPPGIARIKFYWKFYSEEFLEWCNSEYQDTFSVTLTSPEAGERYLVNVSIDDLCPQGIVPCEQEGGSFLNTSCVPCDTCGNYWEDRGYHLKKADVAFDKKGVYMTDWQVTTVELSGTRFSNKDHPVPVTLTFAAGDKGDSIYDTAILIDAIEIE